MRRYIRELRPTSVYDLAAMVALFRPGPDGQHPGLHPPQARPGGGDATSTRCWSRTWRRPTGSSSTRRTSWPRRWPSAASRAPRRTRWATRSARRSRRVLRVQKEKFVTQAAERGVDAQTIDAVFKAFEPFERYGFNKAHATCYGLIAYQTAYLKANYTVEYMTTVLTAFRDNTEKVAAADRRVPAPGHRGPAARRPPLAASTSRSRATRSGSGCWPSRTWARARSSRSSRRARRAASSGRWPTSAPGSTCGSSTARCWSRWPRSARSTRSGTRPRSCSASTTRIAVGQAAQRDRITGQTSLFDMGGDDASVLERPLPATPRRPSASGCAGRRSCWGSTCPTTRWASSPTGSART